MSRGVTRAALLLLGASLVSGAVGFGAVWWYAAWQLEQPAARNERVAATDPTGPPATAPFRPNPAGAATEVGETDEFERDAPPEVPPGPTPNGVALDGAPLYLKCWDDAGRLHRRRECGRLKLFERRFASRLYVVDRCKRKVAGAEATGKLSLGIALDFSDGTIGVWSGPSSDIRGARQIATCLRDELAGLPLHGVEAPQVRYRLFQTVIFGVEDVAASGQHKVEEAVVRMDRVRVREQPVDGRIIGKLNSGSAVTLLDRKKGWCRIVTPASRVGWIICDAVAR
jgi:hypothetical protein